MIIDELVICKNYETEEIVENKISKFLFFPRGEWITRVYNIKEYAARMINRQQTKEHHYE